MSCTRAAARVIEADRVISKDFTPIAPRQLDVDPLAVPDLRGPDPVAALVVPLPIDDARPLLLAEQLAVPLYRGTSVSTHGVPHVVEPCPGSEG